MHGETSDRLPVAFRKRYNVADYDPGGEPKGNSRASGIASPNHAAVLSFLRIGVEASLVLALDSEVSRTT